MTGVRSGPRPRVDHLWALALLVVIAIVAGLQTASLPDYWVHLVAGRDTWLHGAIPSGDAYSHTANGLPYPSYQRFWLADLAMYLTHQVGGAVLAVQLNAVAVVGAYALVLWVCRQASGSWTVAAAVVAAAALIGPDNWNVRPQTAAFLFLAVLLVAVWRFRHGGTPGWLLVMPAVLLLWGNTHGSFPIGLGVLGAWFVGEAGAAWGVRRSGGTPDWIRVGWSAIALVGSSVAAFVSPGGAAGALDYLRTMGTNRVVQQIVTEWQPPGLGTSLGVRFYLVLCLSAVVLVFGFVRRPARLPTLEEVLLFVAFGALGVRYTRGVIWFGLVLAPVLAAQIAALLRTRAVRSATSGESQPVRSGRGGDAQLWMVPVNRVLAVVLVGLALAEQPVLRQMSPWATQPRDCVASDTPVAATEFLRDHVLPGRLFNSSSVGSYLTWAAPGQLVFVDSRIELYPDQVWLDYLAIADGKPGWPVLLDDYRITTVFLSRTDDAPMIARFQASDGWVVDYEDPLAVILTRR